MSRKSRLAVCLAFLLAGCSDGNTSDGEAGSTTSQALTCRGVSQCMLDECSDEFEALDMCVEDFGAESCDTPNLQHSHCLESCGQLELSKPEGDAAFALYLCEVGDDANDCSAEAMACGPAD